MERGAQDREHGDNDANEDDEDRGDQPLHDDDDDDDTLGHDSSVDDDRFWEFLAIRGHKVDPDDPSRLQLHIEWAAVDGEGRTMMTWEPECLIQEDCPAAHRRYFRKIDRAAFVGDTFHILHVIGHRWSKMHSNTPYDMKVSWVGSSTTSWEPEHRVQEMNKDLLNDYWESQGGRG